MAPSSVNGNGIGPTTVDDEGAASVSVHQPQRKQDGSSRHSRQARSTSSKTERSARKKTSTKTNTKNNNNNSNNSSNNRNNASTITNETRKGRGGSVMWTILLAGLLFSLADVFYMVWLVDRHSGAQGNRATLRAAPIKQPRELLLKGKQRILDLIERAGIDSSKLDDQTIEDLPSWEEVVRLFGPKPIIYGLDRCQQFQDKTKKLGFIGTAGAFLGRPHMAMQLWQLLLFLRLEYIHSLIS